LASLRTILVTLKSTDAAKLGRALDDAEEEAKKPTPDKHEVGSALERALKVATKASDFAESGVKLAPYVKGAVAWLGRTGPTFFRWSDCKSDKRRVEEQRFSRGVCQRRGHYRRPRKAGGRSVAELKQPYCIPIR
jgi:hypothetical protein